MMKKVECVSNNDGSYPRLLRLLGLVELLRSGHRRNSRELAESLNVSRRTIFRDVSTLQSAGVQISYDSTSQSYCLRSAIATYSKPAAFDALSMALLLRKASSPLLRQAVAIVETEIINRFNSASRDQVYAAMNWIVSEPAENSDVGEPEHLRTLFDCYYLKQKARINYVTVQEQPQWTLLSPSQLVVTSSNRADQVIVGHSSYHRETIGIPLTRILSATPTEDLFEPADRHLRIWRQE